MGYKLTRDFWVEVQKNGSSLGFMKFSTLDETIITESVRNKYGDGKYVLIINPEIEVNAGTPLATNWFSISSTVSGSVSGSVNNPDPNFSVSSSGCGNFISSDSELNKKCSCDLATIMSTGCKCGGK